MKSLRRIFDSIKFIGDGAAFAHDLKKTSFYFTCEQNLYLFECNWDTFLYFQKHQKVLHGIRKINIMISHTHEDHVNGLSTFLLFLKYAINFNMKDVLVITTIYGKEDLENYLEITGADVDVLNFTIDSRVLDDYVRISATCYVEHCGMNACMFNIEPMDKYDMPFVYTGDLCKYPMSLQRGLKDSAIGLITEVTLADTSEVHMPLKKILHHVPKSAFQEKRVKFVHFDNKEAKQKIAKMNLVDRAVIESELVITSD